MKPKTKAIIFIIFSFLLGIFCGWFLEDRLLHHQQHPDVKRSGEFLKILTTRCHLNDQQVAQIDSLLELNRQKIGGYKKQMLALRDTTRQEIRTLLNEEQKKLFDGFVQEKDKQEFQKRENGTKKGK